MDNIPDTPVFANDRGGMGLELESRGALLRPLMNLSERKTFKQLESVCKEWGARVFSMVRVADVITIDAPVLSAGLKSFGLMAHFDFVVCNKDTMPVFAVEFDGPCHAKPEQMVRDRKKDALCDICGLPLLRINSRYLSEPGTGMTVLTWLVGAWFLEHSFYQAQVEGFVPLDEPFDPWFVNLSWKTERYPFWLSREFLSRVRRLNAEGFCPCPGVNVVVAEDHDNVLRAFAFVELSGGVAVCAKSAMKHQAFPRHHLAQILEETVLLNLDRETDEVLAGKRATPTSQAADVFSRYSNELRLIQSMSSSGPRNCL